MEKIGLNLNRENLERKFPNLIEEKVLDLDNNKIETINENSFNFLSQFYGLRLDNNQIETINENTFNGLSQLNGLYLNNNQLRKGNKYFFFNYLISFTPITFKHFSENI